MNIISTWKKEDGWVEYEPATLDEIAQWLSEGYEVYLDEELTKSARDLNFGWLTITPEYIDACEDEDALFLPNIWDVVDSQDETTDIYETPIKLSAEGRAIARQWQEDASVGYDLCNGKCKGLAGKYSNEEMWNLIESDPEYHL